MLAPPPPKFPKRQIVDAERALLNIRFKQVLVVREKPSVDPVTQRKTLAIVEFIPGEDDASVQAWLHSKGPFYNLQGIAVTPLQVNAVEAHRKRTRGTLYKRGPAVGQTIPVAHGVVGRMNAVEAQLVDFGARMKMIEELLDIATRPTA